MCYAQLARKAVICVEAISSSVDSSLIMSGQRCYFFRKMSAWRLRNKCSILQHMIKLRGYQTKQNRIYSVIESPDPERSYKPW